MRGKAKTNNSPRRQIAYVGAWNTLQLDCRNPYTIVFWSIAYGGFGHILLDKFFHGFILVTGEIFLNTASHLNLAIFYTISGKFDLATQVLDARWFTLYLGVYCFAIFDSYREAVNINKTYILAAREDAEIKGFAINSLSFSHLNSVSPLVAATYSVVIPGLGCFIIQRMNRAIFLMVLWIVVAYMSGLYPAVIHTIAGQFDLAKASLNIQWFLNISSIWFYAVYEAYACAIENNKLYRWELSKFMRREYQSRQFIMPNVVKEAKSSMYLYSIFEHSARLEEAVTALQMKGIPKDAILAVPLDRRNERRILFDTVHSSDGTSMLALPMIFGMIGSLLTSIIGFQLEWGPVLWGVIGAIGGFLLGFGIKLLFTSVNTRRQNAQKNAGVIVVVHCEMNQADMVQDLLWSNAALGVSKLSL